MPAREEPYLLQSSDRFAMQQAELTPLITIPDESSRARQKISSFCKALGQSLLVFLTYFCVIATLPLSFLVCARLYEDNFATVVTRFGRPVKPWTCLLFLFDVYFVLPYIDRVEKINLNEDSKLRLGPRPFVLHLRDGVRLRLYWCFRLLSTTKFSGSVRDKTRQTLLTEAVETTMRRFGANIDYEAFLSTSTCQELVQTVANRLKEILPAPPFPPTSIHNFDVQVGRLALDSLGRNHYFEVVVHSPIMTIDDKDSPWAQ